MSDDNPNPHNNAIPIGSHRYEMAGLSFFINRTPKDVIQEWLMQAIKALQDQGQFDLANKLTRSPQPFFNQPHAMAVFMAASIELEIANSRIDALEKALTTIGTAFADVDGTEPDSWFTEILCPAVQQAVESVAKTKEPA